MLEDPAFDHAELAAELRAGWGAEASRFVFVPGYDMRAASYDVSAGDRRYFLKVRSEPPRRAPLEVPRALLDAGVTNVLAPIPTVASSLWHPMADGRSVVLYPFVAGRNAMVGGLPEEGWRTFGTVMRAVHDSGLQRRFADSLPTETFGLPSAAVVRDVLARQSAVHSPAASRLHAFLDAHAGRIGAMIERAEELGAQLRRRAFAHVLCHADIHAANILVADDGHILLVDWDGPMLAPRERDLFFVIGSRIARRVEPHEEAWFFAAYGKVDVDHEAIVYYRLERILEDIGEVGRSVYADHALPESSRAAEVRMVESFFAPGANVETVERR